MPNLKIKVTGSKRSSVNSNWETHIVDSTLHPIFSGIVDGFVINNWEIIDFEPAIVFKKSGSNLAVGDQFTIADINNGIINVEYYHNISNSADVRLLLSGQAKYNILFTVNSIV